MNLKKTTPSNENGFTFIEVVVAIAIISFSAYVIWNGMNGAMSAVEKVYDKSRITIELSQFEYLFRTSVNEIKTPYWNKEIEITHLNVYQENDILYLEAGGFKHQFKFLHLEQQTNDVEGVELVLSTTQGSQVTLFANYGSFLLLGDK